MKKMILIPLVLLSAIGASIGSRKYEQHVLDPEINRLNSLAEQVRQKAIGDDNYFSSKEQADFLRGMGYTDTIIEGEEVDFSLRGPYPTGSLRLILSVGDREFIMPEEIVKRYLEK